jgi:[CysO sulfur-carrier protein]-S-L-cysteine hydrolase
MERPFCLFIPGPEWGKMESHVADVFPEEACGLLAGRSSIVRAVIPVTNSFHSPDSFKMDPNELLVGLMWIDCHDLELTGVYHSHPAGPHSPSSRDIEASLGPNVICVIWSPAMENDNNDNEKSHAAAISWQARGFIINRGSASEIDLRNLKDNP